MWEDAHTFTMTSHEIRIRATYTGLRATLESCITSVNMLEFLKYCNFEKVREEKSTQGLLSLPGLVIMDVYTIINKYIIDFQYFDLHLMAKFQVSPIPGL